MTLFILVYFGILIGCLLDDRHWMVTQRAIKSRSELRSGSAGWRNPLQSVPSWWSSILTTGWKTQRIPVGDVTVALMAVYHLQHTINQSCKLTFKTLFLEYIISNFPFADVAEPVTFWVFCLVFVCIFILLWLFVISICQLCILSCSCTHVPARTHPEFASALFGYFRGCLVVSLELASPPHFLKGFPLYTLFA